MITIYGAYSRPLAGGEYASVSAGYYHSCGVRTDGSVACWGDGSGWQSPCRRPGEHASVSAGHEHDLRGEDRRLRGLLGL